MPRVAAAVAVAVHAVLEEGGRDELGVPHAARPGAAQFVPAHVAAFDELQEGDELLFGEVAAAAFIGKRRERLDEVDVAGVGAVGTFHAPDGDDVGCADAALAFQLLQQAAVLREFGAPFLDAVGGDGAVQICPDHFVLFGLFAVGGDDFFFVMGTGEELLDVFVADTGGSGALRKRLLPIGEVGRFGRLRRFRLRFGLRLRRRFDDRRGGGTGRKQCGKREDRQGSFHDGNGLVKEAGKDNGCGRGRQGSQAFTGFLRAGWANASTRSILPLFFHRRLS